MESIIKKKGLANITLDDMNDDVKKYCEENGLDLKKEMKKGTAIPGLESIIVKKGLAYITPDDINCNGIFAVAKKHCEENGLDLKKELNKGKAIPGLMKDEVIDSEITEVVSVKAK